MSHPTEPNVRTCPHCGEPYIAEWIDLTASFSDISVNDQTITGGFSIATTAPHTPCPARTEPQAPAQQ